MVCRIAIVENSCNALFHLGAGKYRVGPFDYGSFHLAVKGLCG